MGTLRDSRLDMWYLEGAFSPADTPSGRRFAAAAAALDMRAVFDDPRKGIRALLRDPPSSVGTTFVVMSLRDGRLFGRCVFDPRAVAQAEQQISESCDPPPPPPPPRKAWWHWW